MHVLLDARPILGPQTGDRSYWLGLCRALPAARPDWTFSVALDAPPPAGLLPALPNLRPRIAASPRGRLWAAVALPRLAREVGADLVHLQYVAPPLRCPYVTTIHDVSFALYPRFFRARDGLWLRTLVPPSARGAAAVIADSGVTRDDLLRLYRLPPDRVHTVTLGLDASFQPPSPEARARVRARYGLEGDYLVSVGVLQPRKNVAGLLRAYARARRCHGLRARLAVVGKTGWKAEPIFAAVRELGLADDVKFTGYVPDEDLPGLYGGALLSLYPSVYEGFGLPPLESLACGTPVLISTAPALLETAGPVAPALDPHDLAAWAQAMAELAADAEERACLAAAGRQWAARFTWERSAAEHLAVYEAAVKA
jgi:glycosyltransferase involved in cell wall biosynthesis